MRYFYYFRDEKNRPLITVCLDHDVSNGTLYRGIAICSPKDNPNKRTGKSIASGRAIQAWKNKRNSGKVNRNEARYIYNETGVYFPYKSTSDFLLTPFEHKLIKGERK